MTLSEKWNVSAPLRLLGSALLNAAFLAAALLLMAPAFESNDDTALAAFVDGQRAVKSACIPYINVVLALLLKGIYSLLGEGAAWHAIGQYLLLFAGFTALGAALFERLPLRQGALILLVLLLFFGADAYIMINYTKTCSVATVGGLALLLEAAGGGDKGGRRLYMVFGTLLALFGVMLRFMEFLPCAALMSPLALYRLSELVGDRSLTRAEKRRRLWRRAAPLLLFCALAAGLWGADRLAWSQGRWGEYAEFDAVRVALTDYGIPEYESMPEEYEALGLNKNAVDLFRMGNFYDPDNFGQNTMAEISRLRALVTPPPTVGECLGKLLDNCLERFFETPAVYAFLLLAVLWLGCGDHSLRGWLTLLCALGLFALFYMYLIWRGRYMLNRVDMGLFLALCAVAAGMLLPQRLDSERTLTAVVLTAALGCSFLLCRGSFRSRRGDPDEALPQQRAAVDLLIADREHVYLAKLDTIREDLYSAFEPMPAGYSDRIVLMGGWDFGHPVVADTLAGYGVVNPYRDLVDNDRAYMIEDDIDSTLRYIRDYYCPQAQAELVEPISSRTGLEIYRIIDGGEADA